MLEPARAIVTSDCELPDAGAGINPWSFGRAANSLHCRAISPPPPSHIFESESLIEPGAYCFSYTDYPRSPGICLSPKRWSYSACRQAWLSGNLNLGPHTYKASVLPPESSPKPKEISWRDNLYIEIHSVKFGSLKWKYFLCICLYYDRRYLIRTSSLKRSAVIFCLCF